MQNAQIWFTGFISAIVVFQCVAVPALIFKRNDLADVMWGLGFPLSIWMTIYWAIPGGLRSLFIPSLLMILMVTIWGLRLFWHIGRRNLSHSREDIRYQNWRKEWGSHWVWRSYLQIFVLQAVILFVISSPIFLVMTVNPESLSLLARVGLCIWIFGFIFEMIADEQLRRFKKEASHRGQIMQAGLWSWSRHPNYFGEVTQWWGLWIMVADLPDGWVTIISPVLLNFLILKVSGVPMLEELMKKRPGFAEYSKQTSVFFPRPPRRSTH